MRSKWLVRLMLSYIPVFLFVFFFVLVLSYLIMAEMTRNQTVRAQQAFSEQMMHSIDMQLGILDQMMMKEIKYNLPLQQFLQANEADDPFNFYEVSELLSTLVRTTPLVDSVYIVRFSDSVVITDSRMSAANSKFTDVTFYEPLIGDQRISQWSSARSYRGFEGGLQRQVVSLARQAPLFTGTQGLLIVNVSTRQLSSLLSDMAGPSLGYARLLGADQSSIARADNHAGGTTEDISNGVTVHSAYTGWTLETGMKYGGLLGLLSKISYVWIALICCSLLFGVGWMWFAVRRNYRPIQSLLARADSVNVLHRRSGPGSGSRDEFEAIASSMDYLVDQYRDIEKKYADGVSYKHRILFLNLAAGTFKPDTWQVFEARGFQQAHIRSCFLIAEIDDYSRFLQQYGASDQELMKYVLKKGIEEIGEHMQCPLWCEWMEPMRLGIVIGLTGAESSHSIEHVKLCEQASAWFQENLAFTVTFGVGNEVSQLDLLPTSCDEAIEALDFKPMLGSNRIIFYHEIETSANEPAYDHMRRMTDAIDAFRLEDEDAEGRIRGIFEPLHGTVISKTDLMRFVGYLDVKLDREASRLPAAARQYWDQESRPRLQELFEDISDLGEFERKATDLLGRTVEAIRAIRAQNRQNEPLRQVKAFIDANYADQNLSLHMVSLQFNWNPSHLSRMFKEEYSERFIDYVTDIRVKQAKRLLLETTLPVHEIALQVGYIHSYSFIRAFKKSESLTPGDYRRKYGVEEI